MNKIKQSLGIILILIVSTAMMVAQNTISGTITDKNGMPLVGVNVILEGTTQGSVTDFDGAFSITNVEDGSYKLIASSLGYSKLIKQLVLEGQDIVLNLSLSEDAESLD